VLFYLPEVCGRYISAFLFFLGRKLTAHVIKERQKYALTYFMKNKPLKCGKGKNLDGN
jgi:hypothetical protein